MKYVNLGRSGLKVSRLCLGCEREMLPLCEDQGVGVIPWSPMARGRLTRDWSVTSRRTQNDAFALKMYENAALLDKPVIDVVASIAEKHAVPRIGAMLIEKIDVVRFQTL